MQSVAKRRTKGRAPEATKAKAPPTTAELVHAGTTISLPMSLAEAAALTDALRAERSELIPADPATPAIGDALGCIDAAIVDILDSWSLRQRQPNGDCLMSALAELRTARDHLAPREGKLANRGAS